MKTNKPKIELQRCKRCIQMTNHLKGKCLKHKSKLLNKVELASKIVLQEDFTEDT